MPTLPATLLTPPLSKPSQISTATQATTGTVVDVVMEVAAVVEAVVTGVVVTGVVVVAVVVEEVTADTRS